MHALHDFLARLYHPQALILWGGYLIVAAIVFAETGLLAGFFLPGDSLLFTAGFVVQMGLLRAPAPLPQDAITALLFLDVLLMVAAFAGNSTGYWVGTKSGPRLFQREDSRFFKREHLQKTQAFYERHGGKTIILAEFMPFARTFAPVIAGVAGMPYARFMSFNALGVVIWIGLMTGLGFSLGRIDLLKRHVDVAVIAVVLVSITPALFHLLKARLKSAPSR